MKFEICLMVLVGCAISYVTTDMMFGQWVVGDPKSEEVKKVALRILEILDTSGLAKRLRSVKSVKTQIVSGMNYDIIMEVDQMDCTEAQASTNSDCKIAKVGLCQFVYFTQPWTNYDKITRHICWEFVPVDHF